MVKLLNFTGEKIIERTVDSKLISNQQLGFDYLSSFNNFQLEQNENSISYKGSRSVTDFYQVEYLSNTNEDLLDYTFTFDALFINILDLLCLNVYLNDEIGNIIEEEKIYGYALINENGDRDIKFDIYGYTFYSSDIGIENEVDNVALNSAFQFANIDPNGGGAVIYPILNVSNSIVGIASAINNAHQFLQPPDLFWDDPLAYIMYYAKLEWAKSDFIHNNALNQNASTKQPNDFIWHQNESKWEQWKFGAGNLRNNGCGIFAMYNFMYDTGTKVDLPSLIAVTQILNADVVFGFLGVNPYPSGLFIETSVFGAIFTQFIIPIANNIIPQIARTLVDLEFEVMPAWWTHWFGWTYGAQVVITTAVIELAFLEAICVIGIVAEIYWSTMHNMANVLSLYGFGNNTYVKTTLSSFELEASNSRYMIICQFNGISNGNVNILDGAHYYYVRRVIGGVVNNFQAINRELNLNYNDNKDSLYKFIDDTNATTLFMVGMVFKL
ncbi:MAG: hypothetical protein LBM99_03770 [Bacillales bacterium]|jgi:hypothetical protein|nr:hypothetical protein [Bacillales bacterium]